MTEPSELAKALAKFHTNLPDVAKGSTNPAFKSKYADLADIVKVVLPKLAAVGLTWIARPTFTKHGFVLAYELRHESGESVTGRWPLPDPSSVNQQALGSAVTYAKRYALSAVTGIAPDGDDDGNAASAAGASRQTPAQRRVEAKDNATVAITGAEAATDPTVLDKIEDWAGKNGLASNKAVVDAIATARDRLGSSADDAWGPVAEVKP